MKTGNEKGILKVIGLITLAIILILLILSNDTIALNAGDKGSLSQIKTVGDFARYISYNPNGFMTANVNSIFNLDNNRNWYYEGVDGATEAEPLMYFKGDNDETKRYDESESTDENGVHDESELTKPDGEDYRRYIVAAWYTSCLCMYHSAAGGTGGAQGDIVNVIDINTDPANPTMNVHYENGQKNHIENLTEADNQAMTAYAYLLHKATLYQRADYDSKRNIRWNIYGDFSKNLSFDNYISGMNKMYDCIGGQTKRPELKDGPTELHKVKASIVQILFGGKKINSVNKANTVFQVFSDCKVNGKQIIDVDYGGLTNSLNKVDWESNNTGNYLNNAISAGEKATKASCEFKETDNDGNRIIPEVKIVNNNAYIGPFAVIYSGGTPNVSIDGIGDISGWARKNNNGEFGRTENSTIPQSTDNNTQLFYLVVPASSVENKTNIEVNVGFNYEYYTARVAFTSFNAKEEQNLMFYAAKKHNGEINISKNVEVDLEKEITIQKQDASGNNLNIPGIVFEIYNSQNAIVGTLTTDATGKTGTLKLETNKQYTIREKNNNEYGYSGSIISGAQVISGNATVSTNNGQVNIKLERDNVELGIKNEQNLGDITVIKNDEKYPNIKLDNVGFIAEVSSNGREKSYLALYNQKGHVKEVKGTITINKSNNATASEYRVEYVSNRNQATTFITGDNGILTIKNLEMYKRGDTSKSQYSYTLTEISNSHYGYIVNSQKISNVKIVDGKTTETTLGNKQELVKISGYVWIENPQGKSNGYDSVFTNNNDIKDKKLTDLYTGSEGKLRWNENAEIPVKIQLQDKNGRTVKLQPDIFDTDGKYTFKDVKVDELSKYQVVFVYDGFYYTTVVQKQGNDVTINSKAKEVQAERDTLNNQFSEVGENGSLGGQANKVTYKTQEHKAEVEKIDVNTSISANTRETDLAVELDKLKKSPNTKPVESIDNINMGLVIREQPDLSLHTDIEKVIIKVNGYEYSYVYATRNLYTEKQEDQMGVKFENKAYLLTQRYTRAIYASDIQAAKEGNAELQVSIVYKTTIVNESRTLAIAPKQIATYFDSRYEIEEISAQVNVESEGAINDKYKVAKIGYNGQLKAGTQDEIYIRFSVDRAAIMEMIGTEVQEGKSTYYNAVEINKYSSYYTATTGKIDGKSYTSDSSAAGSIYAGIDEDSAPGNIELKLVDHPSGGTQILDTSKYEDDTDAAPALILQAEKERTISGTVWEDKNVMSNGERLGNGIYDSDEKPIANVKVELVEIVTDNNGNTTLQTAKYTNGAEATATTNNEGKYTLGGGIDQHGKYIGILPGTYLIKYMYNNEAYIVGGTSINAMDYKSTIIKSGVIEKAINSAENITAPDGTIYPGNKWYLIDEENRYSDAIDDMVIRNSLSNSNVKYETYKNGLTATMEAKTPIMEIGIEYTIEDKATVQADGIITLVKDFDKIDFGIIQRPKVDYIIEKQITSLEIVGQTGANIVPKGNPYTDKMTYVRALDGQVSAEIDSNLLQSATLKLEYTIKISNNSEIDYTEPDYYYFGRNGETETAIKITKVSDYLDTGLGLDPEKVEENKLYGWLKADGTENTYTYTQLKNDGLISEDVETELKKGEAKIFITEVFNDITRGASKEIKLYASKLLGTSDEVNVYNDVEIIELEGGRTISSSIPGNYIPTHNGSQYGDNHQNDDYRARLVIVPPTGATANYTNYIIAIGATLSILIAGIIIIKKKVIK